MRRHLLSIAAIILGAVALSAVYLVLPHISRREPLLAESIVVMALLPRHPAALPAVLTRRYYSQTLRELGQRLADFRAAPTGEAGIQRLEAGIDPGSDWQPLLAGIEGL